MTCVFVVMIIGSLRKKEVGYFSSMCYLFIDAVKKNLQFPVERENSNDYRLIENMFFNGTISLNGTERPNEYMGATCKENFKHSSKWNQS